MANVIAFPTVARVVLAGPDKTGNFTVEIHGWTGHPENRPKLVTRSRERALDYGAFLREHHSLRLDTSALARMGFEIDARLASEPLRQAEDTSDGPLGGSAA